MKRKTFLSGLGAGAFLGAAPHPPASVSPAPAPSASDAGDAACLVNPMLPYDRPLELKEAALDGPDFTLSRYRGYAVWINVFATWCGPCNDEAPTVTELSETYYAAGLRTIGLFSAEEDDTVRAYRSKFRMRFPIVRDASGVLTQNLQGPGNVAFPTHVFITGSGTLYCYQQGGYDRDSLVAMIEGLLKTTESPLPPDPETTRAPKPG